MATFNTRVAANVDDATERSDDSNFATNGGSNTDIFTGVAGGPYWYSAQRFQNVTIPQGATINSATITFTSTNSESIDAGNNIVYGEDVDDAANFTDTADIVNRTTTTANVTWAMPTSLTADAEYISPDLKTIIQEIVNRGSWSSGNALCIINKTNSGTIGHDVNYYTYNVNSAKAVEIDIDYSASTDYPITASVTAYTLTMQNAVLNIGTKLTAAVTAYTATGIDAILRRGKSITAAVTAFTITAQDATITSVRTFHTAVTTYAVTGINAVLNIGYKLATTVTAYVVSGITAKIMYWLKRTKPSTSWSGRSKPSTTFTGRTKPTTDWTKRDTHIND